VGEEMNRREGWLRRHGEERMTTATNGLQKRKMLELSSIEKRTYKRVNQILEV
jgi:hypothetical protein